MTNKYLFSILLAFIGISMFGQGNTAPTMEPFCAGGSTLTFDSATGGVPAAPGSAQNYGCLSTQPNPSWFYLQVGQGGNLEFDLTQVSTNGTPIDVDFITWGPFPGPPPIYGPTNLNSNTEVDCSYSGSAQEDISIPNAPPGAYYVVLITNFNGAAGQISLTQTNINQPGAGTTDCDIVCPLDLENDFVLCPGETSIITATIEGGTYVWKQDDVVLENETGQSYEVTEPGVYTVIVNKPGCVANAEASVTVSAPTPMPLGPAPDLTVCGMGPGPFSYDLNQVKEPIWNGLNRFQYPISFYTNQNDATEGFNRISAANAANYQSPGNQTIFVRIENPSGCAETKSFRLLLTPGPTANTAPNMQNCDIDGDGSGVFDLTTQDPAIYGEQAPDEYTITYHITADGAAANTGAITNPEAFEGTNNQTIYARITNNDDEDCFAVTSFNLIVTPRPEINNPDPITICDTNNADGVASFDLTPAVQGITDDEPGLLLTISAHATQADADANRAPLAIPGYNTDQTQNQTIYFRVSERGNTNPQCYTVVPLALTVNPKPEPEAAAQYNLCDNTNSPDGVEVFDLTTKTDEIKGADDTLVITYYTSSDDATNEVDAIPNPSAYSNTRPTEIIWARAESPEGCFTVTSFTIKVNPLPVIDTTPEPYTVCEEEQGSAEGQFNLPTQDVLITQGAAGYTVLYYNTLLDAQTGGANNIVSPYPSGNDTVFARVTNTATGCVNYTPLDLVVTPVPVAGTATPLEACDANPNDNEPNQYVGVFNLTPAIAQIVNGQTGLTATVHETLQGAELNGTPVSNTTTYRNIEIDGTQTVYVRLQSAGGCFSIGTIDLIVHPIPTIATVGDYDLCDDNNSPDGVEVFDLTTKDAEVTSTPGLAITYYTNSDDATAGTGAIANPSAFTNTESPEQQIWVRLESEFGCFSTDSFTIRVNPLPVIDTTPDTDFACEETPGEAIFNLPDNDVNITMGAAGYNVIYYNTQDDANAGGDNYLVSPFPSGNRQVFVRVEDANTGCASFTTLNLEVLPAPIAATPAPLEVCDDNNDEVATFNMDPVIAELVNALGAVAVTIHETPEDANFGENAIPNTGSYSNILANTTNGIQTVYIRVESNLTECFDVVELQLIVHPRPEATEPAPYELCDDNTDGQAIFNLTTRNEEVLGDLDPALYAVAYYEVNPELTSGANAISNPVAYASTTKIIFVKVTDNATGCFDVVELELIVNPLPVVTQPTPYTLCDVTNTGDEREVFDLTTKIDEITGGQEGVIVTFHHTFADAQGDLLAIANPEAYTNGSTVETLFVRVENEETGCFSIVLLDVRVEPLPILTAPSEEDLTICDPDGDGIAQIDLFELTEDMINNGQDITVKFYETEQDAINGVNAIPNPESYVNQDPFFQQIWVVAENTVTGCQNLNALLLELIITTSPQLPELPPLVLCDEDADDQDGTTRFDLTQQNELIFAAPGIEDDYVIHYFTSNEYAEAGAPRITNDTSFPGSDGDPIWVRVEDPSGCYGIATFTLQVGTPLELTTPAMYTVCNSALPNDTVETFDLTTRDDEILGEFGVGQGFTVQYFESQADVDSNTPIATPEAYTNPVNQNPKTLFVVVTTTDGCRSYTTLTIKVLPLPTPDTTPDALVVCDIEGTTGTESFDLTLAEADIRNNDNTTTVTYHLTAEDADQDINAIADPANFESGNATVYVRVEANTNNPADPKCYQVVELQLIVNPLPVLGNAGVIPPFAHCEQNTDGFDTFILTEHNDEVLGTLDPANYRIRYYLTEINARDGAPALPTEYTNAVQGEQQIWVRVDDNTTGCIAIGAFSLFVEESAIANAPADPNFFTCDTDGTNDGIFTFDLTTVEAEVLGTQDPASYSVAYYESEADAEAGQNAIATPEAYNNTFSPDMATIWIRVTNTSTISLCHDVTSIELVVERLPEPVINTGDMGNTVCIEYGTNDVLRDLTLNSGITEPGFTYQWYKNGTLIADADPTSGTYTATSEGSYTVIATSPLGCVSSPSPAFAVVESGPAVAIGSGYTVTDYFSDLQVVTVNVEGNGTYEYKLDDGPWQTSNVFTNVLRGPHVVTVRDVTAINPCDDLIISGVSIVDYPKVFTPNGDGYHDYWNVTGFTQEENGDAKIYIFDRYGKLIKQISSQSEGWDGTFNGTPLPGDDYWFTITYKETVNGVAVQKEFKAHFALKR